MQRADIVDRKGRILATNFETHSLYAQPQQMIEPLKAADRLAEIFPDLDRDRLFKDFTGNANNTAVACRHLTPSPHNSRNNTPVAKVKKGTVTGT